MFRVQAILPCILSSLYVSQAFLLGPLVSRTGLAASMQYRSARVCRCSQHSNWYGGGGSSRGRGTESALWMNHLEEVPDALSDKVLELECPETGRVLECYAERFAVVNGQRYLAAYPKDPAVAVAFDEDGQVAPVPIDDPLMDKLFPLAQACIADLGLGITLLRTPVSLTAKGLDKAVELLEDEADEEDMDIDDSLEDYDVEGGEDDGEVEEEDEFFDEGEEVELLGEFFLEGEEFLMVRFLEPLLMLAMEKEPGRFVLLSEEEDQDANPAVEEMLSGEVL